MDTTPVPASIPPPSMLGMRPLGGGFARGDDATDAIARFADEVCRLAPSMDRNPLACAAELVEGVFPPDLWEAARNQLVARFAWGIPNEAALAALAARGPLVEIGAGTGYWAALLQRRGVAVWAYDRAPPGGPRPNTYGHRHLWTPVAEGDATCAARHPEATLFLCWPAKGPMAVEALAAYTGSTVAYVGPDHPLHTYCAPPAFFEALQVRGFRRTEEVAIPRWPDCQDRLHLYARGTP